MKKRNKNNKTILFISNLDFSKTGNQTLLNTILGYLRNNFKVILLTSSPKVKDVFQGIDFPVKYRKNFIIKRFCPLLRYPRKIAIFIIKNFKNLFLKNFENEGGGNTTQKTPFTYNERLSFVSFFFGGFIWSIILTLKYKPKIICGYEPCGILPGWLISRIFSIKFITRFQGTILFPEMKNKIKAFIRFPFHIISMILPVDLVIMGNDGTRGKEVLIQLGIPEKKIKFWVNGTNKEKNNSNFDKNYILKKFNLKKPIFVILSISRLAKWKKVNRSILAMKEVSQKNPEAILIIVGGGNDEKNLKNLTKSLNLDEKIIFAGAVKHNEVKHFINNCDILLSLYDYSNLCNPVLEALRCGKSIISINDGSTKNILIHNYNSILIEKTKLKESLPQEIIKIINNDKLRKQMEINAKTFSQKNILTWPERMDLEINEINKILN